MKINEILDLNCTTQEGNDNLQKALKRLKPFKKYLGVSDVPFYAIEKFIGILHRKYHIMIQYITPTYIPDNIDFISCSFKRTDTHEWLGCVYGCSMYELYAKACIKLVYCIKNLDIPVIDWEKVKKNNKEKISLIEAETKRRTQEDKS